MSVKRYEWAMLESPKGSYLSDGIRFECSMVDANSGRYVLHSDYAALQAKAQRLEDALEKISDPDSAWIPHLLARKALSDYRGDKL